MKADHDELRRLAEAAIAEAEQPVCTTGDPIDLGVERKAYLAYVDASGPATILALLDEIRTLRRIGRALLEHDERGQGVGWSETMDALHKEIIG